MARLRTDTDGRAKTGGIGMMGHLVQLEGKYGFLLRWWSTFKLESSNSARDASLEQEESATTCSFFELAFSATRYTSGLP